MFDDEPPDTLFLRQWTVFYYEPDDTVFDHEPLDMVFLRLRTAHSGLCIHDER